MYDELIKALRNCTNPNKCCEDCGFFDKCYKNTEHFSIEEQAADAIEELWKKYLASEVDNTNLTGWLAEEHAKHLWVPVTERLPERLGNYLVYVNYAKGDLPFVGVDFYSGNSFLTEFSCPGYYRISHWMPLPEPPQEENNG